MRKKLLLIVAVLLIFSSVSFSASIETSKDATSVTVTDPNVVKMEQLMKEFNSLSKKEQKAKIKETRKYLKELKRSNAAPEVSMILLVILALFIPPLAVYLHEGALNSRFWISLILTLLFFIPGVIYSLIVILGAPKG